MAKVGVKVRLGAMGITVAAALGMAAQTAAAGTIAPLTEAQRTAMTGIAWKPGCPVALDDLVSVAVTYQGFDGKAHDGALVVNKRIANDVASLFADLYAAHFPVNRVDSWEKYGSTIYAEQNITVGFYCEKADDAPNEWSSHAYGMAIDINPLINPFLDLQHNWWPKVAAQYTPRDGAPGKVSPQGAAFQIFTRHGWIWGGFDAGVPDYMHFMKVTVGDGARMDRPYEVTGLRYIPGGATETAQPK
ncbi:MAG: M15 family metallopeptidase [Azospirillaceae bacterium]|nr:M15 family metallopeptidase [Azospirillaceae bacterium]